MCCVVRPIRSIMPSTQVYKCEESKISAKLAHDNRLHLNESRKKRRWVVQLYEEFVIALSMKDPSVAILCFFQLQSPFPVASICYNWRPWWKWPRYVFYLDFSNFCHFRNRHWSKLVHAAISASIWGDDLFPVKRAIWNFASFHGYEHGSIFSRWIGKAVVVD